MPDDLEAPITRREFNIHMQHLTGKLDSLASDVSGVKDSFGETNSLLREHIATSEQMAESGFETLRKLTSAVFGNGDDGGLLHTARDASGMKMTLYGEDGRGGLVAEVAGLAKESQFTKSVLIYIALPILTGVVIAALTLFVQFVTTR